MTVCIAALHSKGVGCVLASDQMTTAHFPIGYEFETDEVEKIVKIDNSSEVYALISGDVLFANKVIEQARRQITVDGIKDVAGIAEAIRESYQEARLTRIIHNELEPRGLSLDDYHDKQQKLLAPLVQLIDNAFKTYNPRVEFIIAGKDDVAAHIFTVVNPGDVTCNDAIGYAAIGSGAPHAIYSLIEGDYKKSLDKEQVEKIVKDAKKRSEVAPGVGRATKVISEC